MNLRQVLAFLGIKEIKIKSKYLDADLDTVDYDKEAAWELYIELVTRITTQKLADTDGDEQTALTSIYKLFQITRDILKLNGRKAVSFSRVSIIVLNFVIRPFLTKWHKLSLQNAFDNPEQCKLFRLELKALQNKLKKYASVLASIADVEDIAELYEDA